MSKSKIIAGEFTKALQDAYFSRTDPTTGKVTMSPLRANPAGLQPLVMKLMELSQRAQVACKEAALAKLAGGAPFDPLGSQLAAAMLVEPCPDNPTVKAYDARLQHYLEVINACIADGKALEAECCFWPVTMPLLIGWYPNEAEDGPDLTQKVRRAADAGYAARMIVMAAAKADFDVANTLSRAVSEAATELPATLSDTAQKLQDAAEQLAEAVGKILAAAARGAAQGVGTPLLVLGGLALAGGALYLHKKGKKVA